MGLETRGFIPPGAESFQTPGKNKENLIKNYMKPENQVTHQEMRDILMDKTENKVNELYETLMEDLAQEEIQEMKRKAKKEALIDQIIVKMRERFNSPEHAKKTQENVLKAISEAIKTIEEQGEDIIKLRIAGQNAGAKKASPVPKEFQGQILEGTEDEEETKIGVHPLMTEDYNQAGKEANS